MAVDAEHVPQEEQDLVDGRAIGRHCESPADSSHLNYHGRDEDPMKRPGIRRNPGLQYPRAEESPPGPSVSLLETRIGPAELGDRLLYFGLLPFQMLDLLGNLLAAEAKLRTRTILFSSEHLADLGQSETEMFAFEDERK